MFTHVYSEKDDSPSHREFISNPFLPLFVIIKSTMAILPTISSSNKQYQTLSAKHSSKNIGITNHKFKAHKISKYSYRSAVKGKVEVLIQNI